MGKICSPSGACVQCLANANCGDAGHVCDTATNRCVASCGSNADCTTGGKGVCDTTAQYCVQCLVDTDCGHAAGNHAYCNPSTRTCVGCLNDANCSDGGTCTNGVCM
ncbi:MAG: hypothetical protein ACRENE_33330 [Polyangiaceae bacterium]